MISYMKNELSSVHDLLHEIKLEFKKLDINNEGKLNVNAFK